MTVFVYVNTNEPVGDAEHIKVLANQEAAETWFEENDPEAAAVGGLPYFSIDLSPRISSKNG